MSSLLGSLLISFLNLKTINWSRVSHNAHTMDSSLTMHGVTDANVDITSSQTLPLPYFKIFSSQNVEAQKLGVHWESTHISLPFKTQKTVEAIHHSLLGTNNKTFFDVLGWQPMRLFIITTTENDIFEKYKLITSSHLQVFLLDTTIKLSVPCRLEGIISLQFSPAFCFVSRWDNFNWQAVFVYSDVNLLVVLPHVIACQQKTYVTVPIRRRLVIVSVLN